LTNSFRTTTMSSTLHSPRWEHVLGDSQMGELAALGSAACWALASIAFTSLATSVDVVAANAFRCLVASLLFVALLPFAGGLDALRSLTPAVVGILAVSVTMIIGIGDTLFFKAMRTIGVSRAMPIAGANPLVTTGLAVAFLGERLTVFQTAGVIVTVAGLLIIVSPDRRRTVVAQPSSATGIVLAVLTALAWGVGTALLKTGLSNVGPVVVNSVRHPAALAFLIGLMVLRGQRLDAYRRLDRRGWVLLLVTSLLSSGLGSLLFVTGLQLAGAARGSVLSSTAPLFSVPLSVVVLHERVSVRVIAGTLLTVVGIGLVM